MKNNKRKDAISENNRFIISTPVVTKKFVKKNGEVTQKKEFYIRRSIQDYFIKFCESQISYQDLENHLKKVNGLIKVVALEIEFRNGDWDNCDSNLELQSRIGEYVIVHKIITK